MRRLLILLFFLFVQVPLAFCQADNQRDTLIVDLVELRNFRNPWSSQIQTSFRWKVFVKGTGETREEAIEIEALNDFVFTLSAIDSVSGRDVLQGAVIRGKNEFQTKALKADRTYKVSVEATTFPDTLVNSSEPYNKGTITFQRNRFDNDVVSSSRVITDIVTDFISKARTIGYFILILLILVVTNLVILLLRLYKNMKAFPKGEISGRGSIRKYLSFYKYSQHNFFCQEVEKRWSHITTAFRINGWSSVKRDVDLLIGYCNAFDSMVAKVLKACFLKYKIYKGDWMALRYMEREMDDMILVVGEELRGILGKRWLVVFSLDTFWIIGTMAPMLGLFGTVCGIAAAFGGIGSISLAQPEKMVSLLATNINFALYTTIGGLIVGALSVLAFYFLKSLIDSFQRECCRLADRILLMS